MGSGKKSNLENLGLEAYNIFINWRKRMNVDGISVVIAFVIFIPLAIIFELSFWWFLAILAVVGFGLAYLVNYYE